MDATIWINFAWYELTATTIVNYFKHGNGYENIDISKHYDVEVFDEFIHKADIGSSRRIFFNCLDFNEQDVFLSVAVEENGVSVDKNAQDEVSDLEQKDNSKIVTKKEVYSAFHVKKDYFNKEGMFNVNAENGIYEISKAIKKYGEKISTRGLVN